MRNGLFYWTNSRFTLNKNQTPFILFFGQLTGILTHLS